MKFESSRAVRALAGDGVACKTELGCAVFQLFNSTLKCFELEVERAHRFRVTPEAPDHRLSPLVKLGEHPGLKLLKPIVDPLLVFRCQHKSFRSCTRLDRIANSHTKQL